jgi:putative ABC transport system permease protein
MWSDLRAAFRTLRRSPAFAATTIVTLAVGIGASSAIFSLIQAVLLQPLPFREPSRLVRIGESNPTVSHDGALASKADIDDWRHASKTLTNIVLFSVSPEPTVLGVGDISTQVKEAAVSPNFFDVLGVQPMLGRTFGTVVTERGPFAGTEIVVSHRFWQHVLGGDAAIIGRAVRVEGAPGSTIVGVMPPNVSLPDDADIWTPMDTATESRDERTYGVVARLADGATIESARAELTAIAGGLASAYPATNAGWTTSVQPLRDAIVGSHRLALLTIFGAVSFVMLVASANVSNLLLARGIGRRNELGVRAALGASRTRLARLLLTETFVMAALGAALGLAFAWLLLPMFVQLAGSHVPRVADARIGWVTVAFTAAIGIVSAIVSGLLPAVRHSRSGAKISLVVGSARLTPNRDDTRLQRWGLACEFAVCLVLLVGAMLFARTFVNLRAVDLGFDPEHVLSIDTRVPIYQTLAPNRWQVLASETTEALAHVRAVPGVLAAAAASDLPLAGHITTTDVTLFGEVRTREARYHRISPDYFKTMGVTLVQGRDFTSEDISDLARLPDPRTAIPRQGAVIVNEAAAKAFWPSGPAIGQLLSTSYDARTIKSRRVVGVVRDVRSESLRSGATPEVYVPYLEDPSFAMTLLVRTALPVPRVVPVVRRELRAVSTGFSTADVRMLDDIVGDSLRTSRFNAFLLSAFGIVGLFLSALGIFGVFAFGVASRIREVGIRIAIGATGPDTVRLFLFHAIGPIIAGIAVGTVASVLFARLVGSLLFGVTAMDAASYIVAASTLAVTALLASYLPVRRLLQSDPARALRD